MSGLNISLARQVSSVFADKNNDVASIIQDVIKALEGGHSCLVLNDAQRKLMQDQACVSRDDHQGRQPFVLEGDRLYLQRYWTHEVQLAARLKMMATQKERLPFEDLSAYFDDEYQRNAAALALTRQLAIITGGPGTGKTTTVVKILTLLLMQKPNINIALAAPTGKAAMRLTESINKGKADETQVRSRFKAQLTELDAVPSEAKTLHRLLGVIPLSPEFRHHRDNPLNADVVVVDEASMIDLGMMNRLVQALKPSAKLILLGDQDQLASVEAGAVLADISAALSDNRVHLHNTYRFDGAIKALAIAVNAGNVTKARDVLNNEDASVMTTTEDPVAFAQREYVHYFSVVKQPDASKEAIFQAFNAFQVLCATRRDKARFDRLAGKQGVWYLGRPVMILENHAELGLFNGDIGITLENEAKQLQVYFPIHGDFKPFMTAQLPLHETVYAMTIHKSQGSEFAHVFIVLPESEQVTEDAEPIHSLLTKELLYTAITRAKKKVTLLSSDNTLTATIHNQVKRVSGLAERLRSPSFQEASSGASC